MPNAHEAHIVVQVDRDDYCFLQHGYARRDFMVPIPQFVTWDAFNTWLEEQCRQRDRLRGENETIGERLMHDLTAMHALPASPFDACDQASANRPATLARIGRTASP